MRGKIVHHVLYLVLFCVFFVSGCEAEMTETGDKEEMVYYASFAGYSIPLKPVERISKQDALARTTYCVGYYNNRGKLYRLEKFLEGRLFFRHDYKYHDNGNIKESKTINAEGKEVVNYFDSKGKPLSR
jgi:hypothetical protein